MSYFNVDKKVFVVADNVGLYEEEAQKIIDEGKYILKYSSVHKVMYSEKRGYYSKCLCRVSIPRGDVGLVRRGRFFALKKEEIISLLHNHYPEVSTRALEED